MGTPTAQVQSSQSSQTSGKGGKISSPLGLPMQGTQDAVSFPNQSYQKSIMPMPTDGINDPSMSNLERMPSVGKGAQPMQGMQGAVTFPGQDGQPAMGQPNPYPNTISSWDNPPTGMSTQPAASGKGKGA
jgi:hypothetical protein